MSCNQRARGGAGVLGLMFTLALAGCPNPMPGGPDAGLPDSCNDKNEALSSVDCLLAADDTAKLAFISFAGDQDWYRLQLPTTLNARSLVEVHAGYKASNTAVNLSVNVLRDDGTTSIARGVDQHGQGSPTVVDLLFPFSEPSARLLVLLSDEGANPAAPGYDVRSQYSVQARVLDNPDVNEPNDTTPTVIPLTAGAQSASGSQTGYLATTNDVDRYAFVVPAQASPRQIAYVHVTADKISPPPPYRLSFALVGPDGKTAIESHVANEFIPVDLATARLVTAGTWQVVVQGYQSPNVPGPVGGDLRLPYQVEVRLMNEQDANEPNDSAATLTPVVIATPNPASGPKPSTTVTGRLDHAPDQDWFAFNLAPNAAPTTLHYTLTWSGGAGRFPVLPGVVDRQVRVFNQVLNTTGPATPASQCKTDVTLCPKGDEGDPAVAQYARSYCDLGTPPLCLRSERNEAPLAFPGLRNFEGVLPIPPHAQDFHLLVYVGDDGNNWADDRNYSLTVQWNQDPVEAGRFSGGVEQVTTLPMAVDNPTNAGFPAPPASATVLSGTLSYGYGRLNRFMPTAGDGVRAALDYDAVPTDVDRFEVDLPAVDPAAGPVDRTWELQWSVNHTADGGYAHDLGLDVTFCDGDVLDGGACTPVGAGNGHAFTLLYTSDKLASWHNASGTALQPVYDRAVTTSAETVTARAYGCFCFEPRLVRGGKLFVNVTGADRAGYEEVPYSVRMAMTGYPRSYAVDGGTRSCPPPLPIDGGLPDAGYAPGCHFTQQ